MQARQYIWIRTSNTKKNETACKAQSEHYTRSTSHWTMHASTVFEERTKLQSSIDEVAAAGRIFNADRFD